jgi:hypothetical protein
MKAEKTEASPLFKPVIPTVRAVPIACIEHPPELYLVHF